MNESHDNNAKDDRERRNAANRNRFKTILKGTGRDGIGKVLEGLDELGFYEAPASTRFHGSYPGGLLQHSLNVYDEAMKIREAQISLVPEIEARLPEDSVAIAALLHDVCKAEVYKVVEKFRKDSDGHWEKYKTYGVDYSDFPLGHGEKSVIRLLRWGLEMKEDEILAIRWHMSGFDLAFQSPEIRNSYSAATEKYPLFSILHAADGLASRILEAMTP